MDKIYADLLVAKRKNISQIPDVKKESVILILQQYLSEGKISEQLFNEITQKE